MFDEIDSANDTKSTEFIPRFYSGSHDATLIALDRYNSLDSSAPVAFDE